MAAKQLNLKEHKIRNHMLQLAVDTEIHRGADGRIYAIDLSRVLPPQEPDPKIRLCHLYRMLRPELVRTNPEPLCSDAASGFVGNESDAVEHIRVSKRKGQGKERRLSSQPKQGVTEATFRLKMIVIPGAAGSVDQLHGCYHECFCSCPLVSQPLFPGCVELTCGFYTLIHLQRVLHVVHALGVNFRFLLRVRSRSQNQITRNLLLCECVSRQIKKSFRKMLRETLVASKGLHDVQV